MSQVEPQNLSDSMAESGVRSSSLDGHGRGRAWTVSVVFHTLLFLLLACFVLPSQIRQRALVFAQHSGSDAPFELASAFRFSPQPDALEDPADLAVDVISLTPTPLDIEPLSDLVIPEELDWDLEDSDPELLEGIDESNSPRRRRGRESLWADREPSTTESISAVDGVEAALGPIEQAIRNELAQGDTLVVWLMDASISLQLNRRAMAGRLAQFQESMGLANRSDGLRRSDQGHRLFNSVVAFGNGVTEVQAPTLTGLRAVEKIARLPNDASGVEKTMAAVNQVVGWYRNEEHRRERMIIVLLTDESGDDGLAIEPTIANCRNHGVGVHVIGPTAVMGLQRGYQLWTSNAYAQPYRFLLRVNRGPETCLPERAFMPYWHETRVSAWRQDVRPADSVPWHGGEYRDGLLSGFGPYTLTRLALQTGGSYTTYDQGKDSRYDQQTLRDYLPEYGSLEEYQASMKGRPLRMFVNATASVTFQESDLFAPLQMMFFGVRQNRYPFAVQPTYINPSVFRRRLEVTLRREKERAQAAANRIEQLLETFASRDLEYDYEREESLRWRAWYDLNCGRLLAASVRYDEYVAACDELLDRKAVFATNVNELVLLPGNEYRVLTSESKARQAVDYLQRCRERHASTQWADLASWELETDFGIRINTRAIPKPPPPRNVGIPSRNRGGGGQSFSFPSL
ncbi:MAG: vWA domain-containing protein [Planctomycetota bacterium]